jgi:hypothetical protein
VHAVSPCREISYLLIICCKTVTVAVQRKVGRVFSTSCGDMAAVNIRCGERPSTRVQAYDRRRRGPGNQICHAGLAHARPGSAAQAEKTSPSAPAPPSFTSRMHGSHSFLFRAAKESAAVGTRAGLMQVCVRLLSGSLSLLVLERRPLSCRSGIACQSARQR